MPAKKPQQKKKVSEAEIFAAAANYERAQQEEAEAKLEKSRNQKILVEQILDLRKIKSMESDRFGGFTRITVVQNESIKYDSDGLYGDLTPSQRRLAFDRNINLNALPAETRKKILEVIPKDELKAVTSHALNVEKLSEAVQSGKISARVVSDNSELVKSSPYVRVSHSSG